MDRQKKEVFIATELQLILESKPVPRPDLPRARQRARRAPASGMRGSADSAASACSARTISLSSWRTRRVRTASCALKSAPRRAALYKPRARRLLW
jgi:hypothetical protein